MSKANYVGIDVGFSGAVGLIAADDDLSVVDMPIYKVRNRQHLELEQLQKILKGLPRGCTVGLEWPTTRPTDAPERCQRFGIQMGCIEAFLFALNIRYTRISPILWKGRLGVPGKTHKNANKIAAELFKKLYPNHTDLIYGPRGGLKDGRLDALLIAHFVRTLDVGNLRDTIDTHGRGSDEAQALVLGAGPKPRKTKWRVS